MTLLSVVVPHWPLDAEIDEALRACLTSLPRDCEKIVVVNQGTGCTAAPALCTAKFNWLLTG
jgi:hypothetical protein